MGSSVTNTAVNPAPQPEQVHPSACSPFSGERRGNCSPQTTQLLSKLDIEEESVSSTGSTILRKTFSSDFLAVLSNHH